MKKTPNIWEYKFDTNANIANFVHLWIYVGLDLTDYYHKIGLPRSQPLVHFPHVDMLRIDFTIKPCFSDLLIQQWSLHDQSALPIYPDWI